jgi:hypothetical protein
MQPARGNIRERFIDQGLGPGEIVVFDIRFP